MAAEILDSAYSVFALAIAFGIVLLGYSLLARADLFREPTTPQGATPLSEPAKWSGFGRRLIPGAVLILVGLLVVHGILRYGVYPPASPFPVPNAIRSILTDATKQALSDKEKRDLKQWLEWTDNLAPEAPMATATP
jgi:hypothetical protein